MFIRLVILLIVWRVRLFVQVAVSLQVKLNLKGKEFVPSLPWRMHPVCLFGIELFEKERLPSSCFFYFFRVIIGTKEDPKTKRCCIKQRLRKNKKVETHF